MGENRWRGVVILIGSRDRQGRRMRDAAGDEGLMQAD